MIFSTSINKLDYFLNATSLLFYTLRYGIHIPILWYKNSWSSLFSFFLISTFPSSIYCLYFLCYIVFCFPLWNGNLFTFLLLPLTGGSLNKRKTTVSKQQGVRYILYIECRSTQLSWKRWGCCQFSFLSFFLLYLWWIQFQYIGGTEEP